MGRTDLHFRDAGQPFRMLPLLLADPPARRSWTVMARQARAWWLNLVFGDWEGLISNQGLIGLY
jgi:hypothetical protein